MKYKVKIYADTDNYTTKVLTSFKFSVQEDAVDFRDRFNAMDWNLRAGIIEECVMYYVNCYIIEDSEDSEEIMRKYIENVEEFDDIDAAEAWVSEYNNDTLNTPEFIRIAEVE